MKAKKPLFWSRSPVLLVVLVLGITGLAVAAPATAVKGTCEFVDYFFNWEGMVVDPVSGDWVMEENWVLYEMQGDLEGTYLEEVTYYGNMKSPVHWSEGLATSRGRSKETLDSVGLLGCTASRRWTRTTISRERAITKTLSPRA